MTMQLLCLLQKFLQMLLDGAACNPKGRLKVLMRRQENSITQQIQLPKFNYPRSISKRDSEPTSENLQGGSGLGCGGL